MSKLVEEIGSNMVGLYGSTCDIEFSDIEEAVIEYCEYDPEDPEDEEMIARISGRVDEWLIANGV